MRTHYPRTPHLPWSPGATADDVRADGPAGLLGREADRPGLVPGVEVAWAGSGAVPIPR